MPRELPPGWDVEQSYQLPRDPDASRWRERRSGTVRTPRANYEVRVERRDDSYVVECSVLNEESPGAAEHLDYQSLEGGSMENRPSGDIPSVWGVFSSIVPERELIVEIPASSTAAAEEASAV